MAETESPERGVEDEELLEAQTVFKGPRKLLQYVLKGREPKNHNGTTPERPN